MLPRLTAALLLILLATSGATGILADEGSGEGQGLEWLNYHQALEKARAEDRHVLVNFTTSWCGYCKKMDATTYRDSGIVATLSQYYALALVDGDSYNLIKLADGDITEKGLTRQFGVRGYPTTWLLEPDGSKIAPVRGYVDYLRMQYILDFVRTNSNETMLFKEYVERELREKQQVDPEAEKQGGR